MTNSLFAPQCARRKSLKENPANQEGTMYPTNVVLITPTMAGEWLERSEKINQKMGRKNNRPESAYTIAKNARIMKRGEWRVNRGAPIAFTEEGIIVNGHHRLKAIVEAGVSVEMAVVFDAEEGDFDIIDNGKKRSLSDIFALEGVANYSAIAAIVTRYIKLCEGKTLRMRGDGGIHGVTPDLYQDYLDVYYECDKLAPNDENLYQYAFHLAWSLVYNANSTKVLPCTDIAAIYVFLVTKKGHPIEQVEEFFTLVFHHGGEISHLQSLSAQLIADKAALKKMTSQRRQSLVAKSWNMFLRKSRAHTVRVGYDERIDFD